MKKFKFLFLLAFSGLLMLSCSESEVITSADMDAPSGEMSSKQELVGKHYNLNIIGKSDLKTADMENSNGHVIFVKLGANDDDEAGVATTNILLFDSEESDDSDADFRVLDANGTDGEASFELPKPGFEPYVTELPFGFDTTTDYSVFARPLGKPLTGSKITTMAELSEIGESIIEKKDERLWKNIMDQYDYVTIVWGDFIPSPVTFAREKGKKQAWQNVTAELLSVVYKIEVTGIVYDDENTNVDESKEVNETLHVRIPIFNELLEGEYWKYENGGLKLLQLRFYKFGTDVTYADITGGWGPTPME